MAERKRRVESDGKKEGVGMRKRMRERKTEKKETEIASRRTFWKEIWR